MNCARLSVNDLARACAHSADAEEWQELVRRCAPLASLVALRVSRMWAPTASTAVVDDIVQEVFLKFCEKERRILRRFEPRGEGSFMGLLRIVATSVANDYFRRLYSIKRGGGLSQVTMHDESLPQPINGARASAPVQQAALLAQLDDKLSSAPDEIKDRDRTWFWLYYLQGYSAEEIARLFGMGLTAKGVESALRRVTDWLRAQVNPEALRERAKSG